MELKIPDNYPQKLSSFMVNVALPEAKRRGIDLTKNKIKTVLGGTEYGLNEYIASGIYALSLNMIDYKDLKNRVISLLETKKGVKK